MMKLYKKDILDDGTQRFKSQLYLNRDTVDFIMRIDGVMRCYGYGEKGFNFYPYNEPYKIVSNIKEMKTQIL
jgi:hypothetical protein